jgi:hypothetical protein
MAQLREAVEKRKDFIINRLINSGFTKLEDGRQFYEMPLTELEHLYINYRIKSCRSIPIRQVKE